MTPLALQSDLQILQLINVMTVCVFLSISKINFCKAPMSDLTERVDEKRFAKAATMGSGGQLEPSHDVLGLSEIYVEICSRISISALYLWT